MKWVANKTFPHPVLSAESPASERDYIKREFQMQHTLKILEDESVHLNLSFALSEQSLLRLIDKNKAKYAVEVHCRKTYTRRLVSSKSKKFSEKFPKGALHERVEISPYIVCTGSVKGHSSKTLHPEFGKNAKFEFVPGTVLAIALPISYWVEPDFVKKIGSIFVLHPTEDMREGKFDIGWDQQKIRILMHPTDATAFVELQKSRQMLPSFLASVYLMTVAETLREMASESTEHDDKKWFHVIRHKLDDMGVELSDTTSFRLVAQELLAFPVGKMLNFPEA